MDTDLFPLKTGRLCFHSNKFLAGNSDLKEILYLYNWSGKSIKKFGGWQRFNREAILRLPVGKYL